MGFEVLGLDPLIMSTLHQMNYQTPTPIQEQTIPLILEGQDVIALAETGSGKTAACAIPICHKVQIDLHSIQALIVVPTRELALQYAVETQKIGSEKKVKTFALYGGESDSIQRAKLKAGVHVLVATPGRLIDFIYSRSIDLTRVNILVLDEADKMLGMGFFEDLDFIMQCLIQEHQTLLFSATMPREIRTIAKTHMRSPHEITLTGEKASPANIKHQFYYCRSLRNKTADLIALLKSLSHDQTLIFCNSRDEVERIRFALKEHLAQVDFLHGGLGQDLRTIITNKFRNKKILYLVATDVAARGLDFSSITHVINYHLPRDVETYLHRAGRTGRVGRAGDCISIVTQRDLKMVDKICEALHQKPLWLGSPPDQQKSRH